MSQPASTLSLRARSIAAADDTPRLRQLETVATCEPIIRAISVCVSLMIPRDSAANISLRNVSWSLVIVVSRMYSRPLQHAMKTVTLFPMCSQSRQVINALGGPAAIAKRWGFKLARVCNWQERGIPDEVVFRHPSFAKALAEVEYGPARTFVSEVCGPIERS